MTVWVTECFLTSSNCLYRHEIYKNTLFMMFPRCI